MIDDLTKGKMKISKWEDLNNIEKLHNRKITYSGGWIYIRDGLRNTALVVNTTAYPKDVVCDVLRCVGFDIEFEEPPKLSKRGWHLVNYLPENWWIAMDPGGKIYAYSSEPHKFGSTWNNGCDERIIDLQFPFITPDRAWSVKELRELEVQK